MPRLPREEYVEQAYLFRGLNNRFESSDPVQLVMKHLRDEILTTTKLPMAIDYLLAELTHVGTMSTAMLKLSHYFAAFQAFVIGAAEDDQGRFDMRRAMMILECEAKYRSEEPTARGMFFFQFETLCQNHLDYDYGLSAMASDPMYDDDWRKWILSIRHKIGMVGIADLIYVYSESYRKKIQDEIDKGDEDAVKQLPDIVLFGEKEGRIALANRNKDPLYFFAALQRQLGYPAVPKPKKRSTVEDLIPKMVRQLERFETRIKMLEDEQRNQGIDLSKFYEDGKS